MKKLTIIFLTALLALSPTISFAQSSVEVMCAEPDCGIGDGATPLGEEQADGDRDDVIRSGDESRKMVPIYGGDRGQMLLDLLIDRETDETLSYRDRVIAGLLSEILVNRWYEIWQESLESSS